MRRLVALAALALCLVTGTSATAATKGSCFVSLSAGGQIYTGYVTRSVRTSCPFPRNVTRVSLRFIIRHGGVGDGDFYVRVYSPVTLKWYRTHCFANGDLYGSERMHVTCFAGIGAKVVYVAHAGSGW